MSVKLSDCLQGREDAVERRSKSLKSVIVFFGGPTTVHYNVLKNFQRSYILQGLVGQLHLVDTSMTSVLNEKRSHWHWIRHSMID